MITADSVPNRASRSLSFLKNIAFSSAEQVFLLLSNLFFVALIARLLGPQGQGVYALALTTALVVTIPFWGLGLGNNYLGNRHRSEIRALLGNTLIIIAGVAIIVLPVLWFSCVLLEKSILAALPYSYRFWLPLWAVALIFELQLRGLIVGLGNYGVRIVTSLLKSSFLVGATVAAAFMHRLTIDVLIPLSLLASLASIVVLLAIITKAAEGVVTWSRDLIAPMLSYSFGATLYQGSTYLNLRFDTFIIVALLDTQSLGLYTLANSIAEALAFLSKGVSEPLVSYTARGGQTDTEEQRQQSLLMLYHMLVLSTVIMAIITALLSPWVIPIFFSSEFSPTVRPLIVLLPGVLGLALNRVASHHLMGHGQTRLPWMTNLGGAGLLIGLDFMLIPRWGIVGAALASTVSYLFVAIILLWAVAELLNISPLQLVAPRRDDLAMLVQLFKRGWLYVLQYAS